MIFELQMLLGRISPNSDTANQKLTIKKKRKIPPINLIFFCQDFWLQLHDFMPIDGHIQFFYKK